MSVLSLFVYYVFQHVFVAYLAYAWGLSFYWCQPLLFAVLAPTKHDQFFVLVRFAFEM